MRSSELGIRNDFHSAFRIPHSEFPRFSQAGFTLVEVILVAVVLGLLLTASVPRFQQTAQRLQTEQTAFALTQLLRYAHERAVAQGDAIVWVWDVQARQAHLESVGDNDERYPINEHVARSRPIHGDITVSLVREGSEVDTVTFSPHVTSKDRKS